jgi:diguanylate cyclase (GGDEF)-like protein
MDQERALDPWRPSNTAKNQEASASDQAASDADQDASRADQAASDLDRDLSEQDQVAADRDQRASEHDQAASDREFFEHPGLEAQVVHDASLAERTAATWQRTEAGRVRALAAEERTHQAQLRDETAWHRDLTAQARDSAADRRDHDSAKIERKMASRGSSLRSALAHSAAVRGQAAEDRARAAEDRVEAAADREYAALEREAALAELRRAHRDELTGAYLRGAGEEALQAEVDRARRAKAPLVLAFVDVDGLREVNNREGHAAGDALLRKVVFAIRSKIRSYEPIVRFGGDEFVCAVTGIDVKQVEERFREIQGALAEAGGAAVSVGFAVLGDEDLLDDVVDRADAALLEVRSARAEAK